MKKILITGSNGFLGKALKKRLLFEGHQIVEMDFPRDIIDLENFNKLDEEGIYHVFHLAGKTFIPDSWNAPQSFYQANLLGTINVLEFCRKKSVSLTFVSAYLYGQPEKLPISENDTVQPNNPYAHSKYLAEEACKFYSKEYNVRTTIIRPFNIYGIGQDEKFLIPYVIKQALEDNKIKVKDLAPKRDYVYLDDFIDALMASMNSVKKFAIYNIGSGISLSVKDVINYVQKILGTDKKIISKNTARKNEINNVIADVTKAGKYLKWHPKTSFYQGIKKVIEHMSNVHQQVPIDKGNYSMETAQRKRLFERYRAEGWGKEYSAYRKNWVRFAKNKVVSEYPLLVDVELASICNLKCPMCYTITDGFKKRVNQKLMDFNLFKKIIREIGGGKVPALRLSLRGEPTLHPKFIECVKCAKDNGIKEVSFLTNGSKLTSDFFKKIMKAGADWITVSIDGMGDVYEGIRKPLKFKETLKKIIDIKEIKRQHNNHKPVIKIQSVWPAIRDNADLYYDTFKPYVDFIAFNPLIDYLGRDSDIVYEDNFSCPQLYQRLVIGSNGRAMLCANDEGNKYIIGDSNKKNIYDIWHGFELNRMREIHKQKNGFKKISVCRRCYLPRATEDMETAVINDKRFIIRNYVKRKQDIGE